MSREIKFRAWDKVEKEMCYAFWLGFKGKPGTEYAKMPPDFLHCNESSDNQPDISDIILMQYTGLKDTNGVEIYEGDVVSQYNTLNESTYVGEVKRDETGRYYIALHHHVPTVNQRCEVIGNIHENPDLQKGKNNGQERTT